MSDERTPVDDPAVDHVEPLADPTPAPWQTGDELDEATAGDELDEADDAPAPLTDDELARILAVVVAAPFDWGGRFYAARVPEPIRPPVRALWPLTPDESSSIAARLAVAIPDRWRASRILAASPALVALTELAAAFQARASATAQLVNTYAAAAPADPSPTPPEGMPTNDDPIPPDSLRARAARAAAGGDGRRAGPVAGAVPGEPSARRPARPRRGG